MIHDRADAPIVELTEVRHFYVAGAGRCRAVARALDGVSVTVATGELVGVVGGRGAGKSTLLRCAAGLLRPTIGTVLWRGVPEPSRGVVYRVVRQVATPHRPLEVAPLPTRLDLLALDDADVGDEGRIAALAAWLAALRARHPRAAIVAGFVSPSAASALAQRVVALDDGRAWPLAPRARVGEPRPAHVDSPPQDL